MTRAFAAIGICSLLVACSATGGAFAPDMLARLLPPTPATGAATSEETTTTVARTATTGSVALASSEDGLAPNIAHPAAPPAPRKVAGRSVDPQGYSEVGLASWYGSQFHGRSTANGETFNRLALTAAHLKLPLPSYVRVTNLDNGRSITVRVNDRGPYSHNRLIDVSEQTAELLSFRRDGLTKVKVDYLGPAPVDADDGQMLLASYRGPGGPAARPQPTRVAFADEPQDRGAEPMKKLTTRPSVMNRILMAFDVAAFSGN